MAADHTWKQGDTAPALTDTLGYSNGSPVDLTGCTVALVMRGLSYPTPLALTGAVTIATPSTGIVQYTPSAADTATPGLYMANWVVTYNNGTKMTFPTVGYISIAVEENLVTTGGQQLVGLPDVKEYLSIPANDRSHDAKLVRFIEAARPLIENVVGPIIPMAREEWHDGGGSFIQIRRRPSTAFGTSPILQIIGCEEFIGGTKYALPVVADPTRGTTYSVQIDGLGRITRRTSGGGVGVFAPGENAVHVWYQAGQASVPANVYEATLEAIRVNYQTTQATGRGLLTQTDGVDTGRPLGFFLSRNVREMLAPNRRAPSVA